MFSGAVQKKYKVRKIHSPARLSHFFIQYMRGHFSIRSLFQLAFMISKLIWNITYMSVMPT